MYPLSKIVGVSVLAKISPYFGTSFKCFSSSGSESVPYAPYVLPTFVAYSIEMRNLHWSDSIVRPSFRNMDHVMTSIRKPFVQTYHRNYIKIRSWCFTFSKGEITPPHGAPPETVAFGLLFWLDSHWSVLIILINEEVLIEVIKSVSIKSVEAHL